jgi:acetyl esterase/lipase
MKWLLGSIAVVALVALGLFLWLRPPKYERTPNTVYGRHADVDLTLDVFIPENNKNGIGVIAVASAGWKSGPNLIQPIFYHEILRRGYTVFAVVHRSQPEFTIPEIIEDTQRAVRFVRFNAKAYGIDPKRIGILGASSGGHLALMQGTGGDDGNPDAADPVERVSSRVQAVGCFYAPTDMLNYGAEGKNLVNDDMDPAYAPAFCYKEFDKQKTQFARVADEKCRREITRRISPITHVNATSAPTLFLHGDADDLVPLQQSEVMAASLQKAGVPAKLIVWEGVKHGDMWTSYRHLSHVADWFDVHLVKNEIHQAAP